MTMEITAGIAPYAREQRVFRRLLRKRGQFTEKEFDLWFNKRDKDWITGRRKFKRLRWLGGTGFNLGSEDLSRSIWTERLRLLQYMVILGDVRTKTENGLVTYFV